MRRAALAAALGLVVVLGALVAVMSQRDTRLAGTNSFVVYSGVALPVPPGGRNCAPDQAIPRDAVAVVVYAGTAGGPRGEPFALTVEQGGRRLASGRMSGDWGENAILRIPIEPIGREVFGARVCVRNLGDRRIRFAGNVTPQTGPVLGNPDVIRTDWLLAGEPTWWDVAPRIVRRATPFKPGFVGAWTFWALLGVVAATWAAGLALVIRRADA